MDSRKFPLELFRDIMLLFKPIIYEDCSALRACRAVCRDFKDIANPAAFTNVRLCGDPTKIDPFAEKISFVLSGEHTDILRKIEYMTICGRNGSVVRIEWDSMLPLIKFCGHLCTLTLRRGLWKSSPSPSYGFVSDSERLIIPGHLPSLRHVILDRMEFHPHVGLDIVPFPFLVAHTVKQLDIWESRFDVDLHRCQQLPWSQTFVRLFAPTANVMFVLAELMFVTHLELWRVSAQGVSPGLVPILYRRSYALERLALDIDPMHANEAMTWGNLYHPLRACTHLKAVHFGVRFILADVLHPEQQMDDLTRAPRNAYDLFETLVRCLPHSVTKLELAMRYPRIPTTPNDLTLLTHCAAINWYGIGDALRSQPNLTHFRLLLYTPHEYTAWVDALEETWWPHIRTSILQGVGRDLGSMEEMNWYLTTAGVHPRMTLR